MAPLTARNCAVNSLLAKAAAQIALFSNRANCQVREQFVHRIFVAMSTTHEGEAPNRHSRPRRQANSAKFFLHRFALPPFDPRGPALRHSQVPESRRASTEPFQDTTVDFEKQQTATDTRRSRSAARTLASDSETRQVPELYAAADTIEGMKI